MSITPLDPANFNPTLKGIKRYGAFRFWCQQVLPLTFNDSLSYYELLIKVVNYLNKTMENVNDLGSDVESLGTAYSQLENYVNTYFSSLDVQTEINNKLDEMASNGSLTTLIAPFIPDLVTDWLHENVTPVGSAVIVDSSLSISGAAADAERTGYEINKLKSDLIPFPVYPESKYGNNGQILRTKGDGKTEWVNVGLPTDEQTTQAISDWLNEHPEATTTVQDGSIGEIKLTDSLAMKALNDYVTPEMFGAKGDGETDDTSAINAAIQYANSNNIRRVQFFAKVYVVAGMINLTNCRTVDLCGASIMAKTDSDLIATRIKYTGQGTCVLFNNSFQCTISGITFWHADNTDSSVGIRYGEHRCQKNRVYNDNIFGFATGISVDVGTGYDEFNNISFSNCPRGIVLNHTEDTVDLTTVNYLYIHRCAFGYANYNPEMDVVCIEIHDSEYVYITECDFIAGVGIYIPSGITNTLRHDIYIEHNIFFACYKSVEILSPINRIRLVGNIHRLGVYSGSIAVKNDTPQNSSDMLIDDTVQYYNKNNVAFPFMIFNRVAQLNFKTPIPANDTITGDSDEVFPMSMTASRLTNTDYIVGTKQWYSCSPGSSTVNYTNSKNNWMRPTSFILLPYMNSSLNNITIQASYTGRQCSLSFINSGSSAISVAIIPVYIQA